MKVLTLGGILLVAQIALACFLCLSYIEHSQVSYTTPSDIALRYGMQCLDGSDVEYFYDRYPFCLDHIAHQEFDEDIRKHMLSKFKVVVEVNQTDPDSTIKESFWDCYGDIWDIFQNHTMSSVFCPGNPTSLIIVPIFLTCLFFQLVVILFVSRRDTIILKAVRLPLSDNEPDSPSAYYRPVQPPTQAPPTQAPPTQAPPTQAPPTQAPPPPTYAAPAGYPEYNVPVYYNEDLYFPKNSIQ